MKRLINFYKRDTHHISLSVLNESIRYQLLDLTLSIINKNDKVPKFYLETYNKYVRNSCLRYHKMISELKKIELKNYFLFKGPVISFYLFGDPYRRFYKDIDLFVSSIDYADNIERLNMEGYKNEYFKSKDSIKIEKNICGDDILYFNKKENFAFEIKQSMRCVDNKYLRYLFNEVSVIHYNDDTFYGLSLSGTIIVQIIYTYFAYFTEYGVNNKSNIRFFIELYLLLKKDKSHNNVIRLIKKMNLGKLIDKISSYYFSILDEPLLNYYPIDSIDSKKILDKAYLLNNYYKMCLSSDINLSITTINNQNEIKNCGKYKYKLERTFKLSEKYPCYSFTFYKLNDKIVLYFDMARYCMDAIVNFIFINNKYDKMNIELTMYKNYIYDFHSKIQLDRLFHYYDRTKKCFVLEFDKEYFKDNVGSPFLFKVEIRKIIEKYYPFLNNEIKDYDKIMWEV